MRKPFFVVLSILSVFFACTKIETTDIGNGLIPSIDGVNTKDTFFDVITNTFIDSDLARVYKTDDHVIGVITNDPLFGKTTASAFFELKPTSYKFAFPGIKDSLTADSAFLIMSYKGVYGDSTIPQTWRVFEINQNSKIKFDSSYPAQTNTISYGNQLGVKSNFDIRRLSDSVNYGFENATNQIRIKLDQSFVTRFIKQYDSTAGNAYANDSLFRANFAGFAVVPDANSGNALIRINLLDTNTKLSLYYTSRQVGSTKRDTGVSYFRFNASGGIETSGNANYIKRDRSGAQVTAFANTQNNDSLVFIQTSPGTFATIKIPNLSSFRNAIIHRAELEVVQAPGDANFESKLTPPRYLLLSAYDSVKKHKVNVPNDYEVLQGGSNIQNFGGFLFKKDVPGLGTVGAYNFTLTRYVQGIVTRNDPNRTLRLYAPSNDSVYYLPPYPFNSGAALPTYISPSGANIIANGRVRLFGGGGQSQLRMRLRIIYSVL